MTKTELKKQELKKVLSYVESTFDLNDLERDYQYFTFSTAFKGSQLSGQIDTRGFDVCIEQNMKLAGNGWSNDERTTAAHAAQLEERMNEMIGTFIGS
mgnify:FL=1|tara:strand:- start:303 stop:596 length:294 start_codon:yes stop_codon:yes gene_type:complete